MQKKDGKYQLPAAPSPITPIRHDFNSMSIRLVMVKSAAEPQRLCHVDRHAIQEGLERFANVPLFQNTPAPAISSSWIAPNVGAIDLWH